jgi:serine/threonine-protein kinase
MIRVSAQLIDGRQGLEKWSEDFDRPRGDALQIQTDIASRVADALKIRLGESGIRALTEGGTRIAAAQDLLLKARDLVARTDTPDAQQHALGLVDSAIALDPGYANAYSAKASLMLDSGGTNGAAVEPTARRAIALAPGSAEAHRTLAFILYLELKFREAFAQLETAASLPGGLRGEFDNGYGFIWMLADFGRPEALDRADEMIAGDPLNAASYHSKGYVLYTRRQYADADRQFLKAIDIAPQVAGGHAFHALMLLELGKLDEADAVLSRLPAYYYMAPVLRAVIAARRGDRALSDRFLAALRSQYGDKMSCQYADIYAQQGLKDQALAELENAWRTRDPGLAAIKTDTLYDPLRSDPRFQALVNKLDFPT